MSDFRLGVDIGGTFTDIVLLGADGTIYTNKVLSTPADYSEAIDSGIQSLMLETRIAPTKFARWCMALPSRPTRSLSKPVRGWP